MTSITSILCLTLSIINLIQVIALFAQWRMDKTHAGPGWWVLGTTALALAFASAYLQQNPALLTFGVVAHTLLFIYAGVLFYIGILCFFGRREQRGPLMALLAVYTLVDFYFILINNNAGIRQQVMNLVATGMTFLIVRALIRYRVSSVRTTANLLAGGFFLQGLATGVAFVLALTRPTSADPLAVTSGQLIVLLASIILTAFGPLGFILMINQRLNTKNREAVENWERIFSTIPDAVLITRLSDGMIIEVNEGFTSMTGYTRAEVLGKTVVELHLYKNSDSRQKVVDRLSANGAFENMELVFQRKDGSEFTSIMSSQSIKLQGVPHAISVNLNITERKRIELDLQLTQFVVDHISDAAIWVRPDSRIAYVNEAACQRLGYTREEMLALRLADLGMDAEMTGDEWAAHWLEIKRLGAMTIESRQKTKSGQVIPIELQITYVQFMNQEYLCGLSRDITARKQAEEALRDSEQRYRTLFENLPIPVFTKDLDGRYTSSNAENLKYWKVAPLGHTDAEILPPEIASAFRQTDLQVMEDQITQNLEEQIQTANGLRTMMTRKVPWRDAAGNVIGILGVSVDITEHKQIEEALRYSESRYARAVRGSSDGIWDWDPQTQKSYHSPRYKALLGYSEDELEGDQDYFKNFIHPDDLPKALAADEAHLERHEPYDIDIRLRSKNGEYRWFHSRARAEWDTTGKPVSMAGSITDITERKQAEAALLEARATLEKRVAERTAELSAANISLEKALRAKDEFLAAMSHELRTPLTGVIGLAQVMQMPSYGLQTDKQITAVKNIESSGRHLLELINDILDYSILQSSANPLNKTPNSLAEICRFVMKKAAADCEKKGLVASLHISPEEIVLMMDVQRIQKILLNLFSNAIKFTPQGGSVGIEAIGSPQDKLVRLTVWDTGIGIKEDDLPRLFQPFMQLDARLERQYNGTGLGLALVKQLAELHGGIVSVESVYGQGSRFTITLPWETQA